MACIFPGRLCCILEGSRRTALTHRDTLDRYCILLGDSRALLCQRDALGRGLVLLGKRQDTNILKSLLLWGMAAGANSQTLALPLSM